MKEVLITTTRGTKPLQLRDAPGIALRHMGDERNRQEAEYVFQVSPELRQVTNQYSFVIENTSGKAIIALSVAYSFPKPGEADAEVATIRTDALHAHLMGASSTLLMSPGSKAGYCLALGSENFDFKNGLRVIQPERSTQPNVTPERRRQMNEAILSRFAGFDRLLSAADRYEVEIEGAIFDDGTFVGTNRRNYFEQCSARLAGARQMVDELLQSLDKSAKHSDLVIQAKAHIVDWKELLKPFGGQLNEAMQNENFLFQFAKSTVAHRFASLPEANGMKYLQYGRQNWNTPKRLTH
jgi:hypothetical protein